EKEKESKEKRDLPQYVVPLHIYEILVFYGYLNLKAYTGLLSILPIELVISTRGHVCIYAIHHLGPHLIYLFFVLDSFLIINFWFLVHHFAVFQLFFFQLFSFLILVGQQLIHVYLYFYPIIIIKLTIYVSCQIIQLLQPTRVILLGFLVRKGGDIEDDTKLITTNFIFWWINDMFLNRVLTIVLRVTLGTIDEPPYQCAQLFPRTIFMFILHNDIHDFFVLIFGK
ncbi:hypothetical protein ACJX0J_025403, partial [Zea mays]